MNGNFSSLEKQRLEMEKKAVETASKVGLATPEERKQPVGGSRLAALFAKPEPVVAPPAAAVEAPKEVAVQNSGTAKSELPVNIKALFELQEQKRARVTSDMLNDVRKVASASSSTTSV